MTKRRRNDELAFVSMMSIDAPARMARYRAIKSRGKRGSIAPRLNLVSFG
jgi:hypothetical protein